MRRPQWLWQQLRSLRRDLRELRRRQRRIVHYTGRHLPEKLSMGRGSYGDPTVLTVTNTGNSVEIGNFCSIADGVTFLLGGGHHVEWVTTAPWLEGRRAPGHPVRKPGVHIGHDVWIGRGAVILEGVSIGTGAVVGAQAVVASDVEPYAIVVGNPAKEIRRRFEAETRERLLATEWWTWSAERIAEARALLWSSDVDAFLQFAEGSRD
jgi:chloramphenicol O-acetyltransferase type B